MFLSYKCLLDNAFINFVRNRIAVRIEYGLSPFGKLTSPVPQKPMVVSFILLAYIPMTQQLELPLRVCCFAEVLLFIYFH